MPLSTLVKVFLSDVATYPLAGVKVSLFDRDRLSADDPLGSGVTDSQGTVPFTFDARQYVDVEDIKPGFPPKIGLPDLYVIVYGPSGETVLSTRSQTISNALPSVINVPMDSALALTHGLLLRKPARSDADRKNAWIADEKANKKKPSGPVDLCVTRVLLDMISGASDPKNDLQKRLASRVPRQDLLTAGGFATQALALLDSSGLSNPGGCNSGIDPKELCRLFTGPGGSLHAISQALSSVDPSPKDNLPHDATAGLPFLNHAEWIKACLDRYTEMHQGHLPDPRQYVAPPRINRVRCYDSLVRHFIWDENPATKDLSFRVLDGTSTSGWNQSTIHMDVDVNSPECLINKTDGAGRQIAVMDVLPTQTLVFYGSGFIADKARVVVTRYLWQSQPNDGRLQPEDTDLPIVGWDAGQTVAVYGASSHPVDSTARSFAGDYVVFDWPVTLAEEGLYQVQLEFENHTDPPYPSTLVQNPFPDCRFVATSGPVATQPVWFAVLPALEPRKVSPRVTHVQCVDETNPERIGPFNYFDDIIVQSSTQVRHVALDASDPQPEVVTENAPDAQEHMFWNDGDGWDLDLHLLGSSTDPIDFGFDRVLRRKLQP